MTTKQILKKKHPHAKKISKSKIYPNSWEVVESDGFEETFHFYEVVGNRLVYIAEVIAEI